MSAPRPPIHSLPTELVSAIFDKLHTPAQPICLPAPTLYSQPEIIGLSQVCREWRATAHSRRELWTSYKFDLTSRVWGSADASALLSLLAEFVSYTDSKDAAVLDIVLAIDQGEEESAQDITSTIVTTYSRRLSVLNLHLPHATVEYLFNAPTLPFDRLQRFEIVMRPHTSDAREGPLGEWNEHTVLKEAPLLTEVCLGYHQWLPVQLPLLDLEGWNPPLAQLTTFRASNVWMEGPDVVQILKNCTQLIICDIRCDEVWTPEESDLTQTPTMMAHLEELRITFRVMIPHLWTYFTAPSLEQLHIISVYDDIDDDGGTRWGQTEFMAFKRRSGFTLTTLALCFEFSEDPDTIIEALDTLQELEVLTLRWTGWQAFESPEIGRLLHKLATATWLPRLHNLTIDGTTESIAVLISRCKSQLADVQEAELQLREITLSIFDLDPHEVSTLQAQSLEISPLRVMGCNVEVQAMTFFGGEDYRDEEPGEDDSELSNSENEDMNGEEDNEDDEDDEMGEGLGSLD